MYADLYALPGKITDKYCSPTNKLMPMPDKIVAMIKLPGVFNLATRGLIALCTMLNFINNPPSDKVEIIKATVSIMLAIPPRLKRALNAASLVLAT